MNWKPYTYLLKCPNGMFYYGVKYGKSKTNFADPSLFWINYFTSCKKVHELISQHGTESFEFEIRKIFKTQEDAIKWEAKVNRRLTTKSHKFLNDSFIDGRIQSGKNNGNYGKPMSEEAKAKMVESRRKRFNGKYGPTDVDRSYITEEYRKLLSDNAKTQHKNGKIYQIIDTNHLFSEYEKFVFPTDPNKFKTRGTRSTKITYFVNNYYIPNFSHLITKSKNPGAMLRRRLRNKYGSE